jgi:hypothetical protein
MAKKTGSRKTQRKKAGTLSEADIRLVLGRVLADLAMKREEDPWGVGCGRWPRRGDRHVVSRAEAEALLDYIIDVAKSLRAAVDLVDRSRSWTVGC